MFSKLTFCSLSLVAVEAGKCPFGYGGQQEALQLQRPDESNFVQVQADDTSIQFPAQLLKC